MAARTAWLTGWTGEHLRHAAAILRQGGNPVARVYESIGADFFLAISPGWLNLGLWRGPGTEDEAEAACRRLVQTVAAALPAGGVILDAGNGLGTQDPLIAGQVRPARLLAVNITEWPARAAGLVDVQVTRCGAEVIAPAIRLTRARLAAPTAAPTGQHLAAQLLLRQVDLLYRHHIIDYLLLRATRP